MKILQKTAVSCLLLSCLNLSASEIDEAITAAAKVAYLTELLQSEEEIKIERFKNPLEIKDWIIEDPQYNKLNKLKKNNPEAFYYWFKVF